MAKSNSPGRIPQAQHSEKSPASRHDKRSRLLHFRSDRVRTEKARFPLVGLVGSVVGKMANLLDGRVGFRLCIIMAGAMLAKSRRTASSWFRAAGVGNDWDRFYDGLISVGKNVANLVMPVVGAIVQRIVPGLGEYVTLAIDDSPTPRYGRHVEGANVHHNPTAGPADGPWMYGHNWVCLAMLVQHPLWGTIALPLLSALYVRQCDIAQLTKYQWKFKTKLELSVELVIKVMGLFKSFGLTNKLLVVADGAYASKPFLKPLIQQGVSVVSRLRVDAKLFDLPQHKAGRGRPRVYGANRINLKKRAGQRGGWSVTEYTHRGLKVTRRYKTFLATSQLVGGCIRVVLLEFEKGNWAPYFSTDLDLPLEVLLEKVSDRWAIEEYFHDVKEVWGAGQQQVRNIWSNIGCWHINSWLFTLVELASWDETAPSLVDRTDRPWDNPLRRPSHADRRRRIVRQMLVQEFSLTELRDSNIDKIKAKFDGLLSLAI
jgi:hypothetical protein